MSGGGRVLHIDRASGLGGGSLRWPLWSRLAYRDLRTGMAGFAVFIGCIALGVMVITGVGALSDALRGGLAKQGEQLLGGDLTFARPHTRATDTERKVLEGVGRLSETATLRTMARRSDGSDQVLAELKGVDASYPLAGAVKLEGGGDLRSALVERGAVVDPALLDRLGLRVGDQIDVGSAKVRIAAKLMAEPDSISDRSTFGPRVLVSLATLAQTGLDQPGTLIRWRYAVSVAKDRDATPAAFKLSTEGVKRALPEAGFTSADRFDPSPQLSRTLERLRQFLTLIGLTSLLVGGVGVANAVATFIDRRRKVIAIMKSLGAPRRLIFRIFLAEILAVTGIGIVIGLVAGYAIPIAAAQAFGDKLPFQADVSVTLASVATAVSYGLLVALLYALWPLGQAELVSPTALFRDDATTDAVLPRARILIATALVAGMLLAFTVLASDAKLVALSFCGGLAVIFAVFWGVGSLVPILARRLPRSRSPEVALAMGNIGAPRGLARSILLSLGLGLSLLVAVALVNASLEAELSGRLPQNSPSYFVLDISKSDASAFENLVARDAPGSVIDLAPMLRGRLVEIKNVPVEKIKVAPEAAWVLTGDRGLSFAVDVPQGSRVVEGAWWSRDYTGEPLVSFEVDLARKLGLKVGDTVMVNVLGRNLTARVASLRELKWDNLALNFVMVFSPSALQAAPYKMLATITLPKSAPLATETALAKSIGVAFPAVTPIRVKDAIAQFNEVLGKILTAVRVAGGVTLVSGALVLAGALATAQRRRILDAVILKALGVTWSRILLSHVVEYGVLALIAALVATLLGGIAAWLALTKVMTVPFVFSGVAVLQVLALALALVALFGGIGTWGVLRAPAVPYLKSE
jgi:putative ABC transport system permease protein